MTLDPADSELAGRVDRALKTLPPPAAPPALLGRVMRAVEADTPAPAAFEWPVALKIALVAVSALIVISAIVVWPLALETARSAWQSPVFVLVREAADTIRPMVPIALLYVTAMVAVSAAAASMLKHVALGGASRS